MQWSWYGCCAPLGMRRTTRQDVKVKLCPGRKWLGHFLLNSLSATLLFPLPRHGRRLQVTAVWRRQDGLARRGGLGGLLSLHIELGLQLGRLQPAVRQRQPALPILIFPGDLGPELTFGGLVQALAETAHVILSCHAKRF